MNAFSEFMGAVIDTEISNLELQKLKLIERRQAQTGDSEMAGAAVIALEGVITAKKAVRDNLPQ